MNDQCPNCHKEEDFKTVCKLCGYEYPDEYEEDWTWKDSVSVALWIFGIIYGIVTIMMWLFAQNFEENVHPSLRETIILQWNLISQLRIW